MIRFALPSIRRRDRIERKLRRQVPRALALLEQALLAQRTKRMREVVVLMGRELETAS